MVAIASSSTSSRTSASSSTSDRVPTIAERSLGWIRLTHPFPSILDGLVSGTIAVLAGGSLLLAVRIALAMTLLQLGIGTVNDIVDAPRDAGRKAGKPIPAGLVSPVAARAFAVVAFAAGLLLAAGASPATSVLAPVVIAIGLAYDLRLKGSAWSWLPFAVGIPILPVFGWAGATGTLPPVFVVLVPAAVAAGAALAIGNALVDVERDRAASVSSIAIALGSARAGAIAMGLLALIWLAAVGAAIGSGRTLAAIAGIAVVATVPLGAALASRRASSAGRERAWQAEAIGLAILGALWLAVMLGPGGSPT